MSRARERQIRVVLRTVASQRVAMILQPGGVWVVENHPGGDHDSEAALRTCNLRGWVEPIGDAIPKGEVDAKGNIRTPNDPYAEHGPVYRITAAGWAELKRSHQWIVASWVVALASLVASLVFGLLSWLFPGFPGVD